MENQYKKSFVLILPLLLRILNTLASLWTRLVTRKFVSFERLPHAAAETTGGHTRATAIRVYAGFVYIYIIYYIMILCIQNTIRLNQKRFPFLSRSAVYNNNNNII